MVTEEMALSHAIRLGATMKPQAFGMMWLAGGSCAVGAAYEAIGVTQYDFYNGRGALPELWRIFGRKMPCPDCNEPHFGIISHLNDQHRWSREKIADWVELHEPMPQPESTIEELEAKTTPESLAGFLEGR